MSQQKKIALNLKIKEKILAANAKNANNPNIVQFKNKSEERTTEREQFKKIYSTGNIFKGFEHQSKYSLPNTLNWGEQPKPEKVLKISLQNPLNIKKKLKSTQNSNDFKRRSSSLAILQNNDTLKSKIFNAKSSSVSHQSTNENGDTVLPLLYIPSNAYQTNLKKSSKKSRRTNRANNTDKISRNPQGLVNTLSNKSLKPNQKSMENFELKANKKLIVENPDLKYEEAKKQQNGDQISVYAGFRTTKGYHPKKPEKSNQDRMLISPKFNNNDQQWVF